MSDNLLVIPFVVDKSDYFHAHAVVWSSDYRYINEIIVNIIYSGVR